MANVQAFCTVAKKDLLLGIHNFGTTNTRAGTGADTFKGALYLASGSLGAATTAYSATSEVPNSGSYVAGGLDFTIATAPNTSGTTAFFTPSASWTTGSGFTGTAFDAILMYNDTAAGNPAVALFTFGSQTVTAGTFTLTMPTNDASTGLIRLA